MTILSVYPDNRKMTDAYLTDSFSSVQNQAIPRIIQLNTNDSYNTIVTANYLTAINDRYSPLATDILFIIYGTSQQYQAIFYPLISGTTITLTPITFFNMPLLNEGSVGAPSLSFISDTTKGIYSPGGNQMAISIAGTQVVNFTNSGMLMNNRLQLAKGADIVSANNIQLGAGNFFNIGTTGQVNTIDNTNWQDGSIITFRVTSGTVTFANNTAGTYSRLRLNGSVNFVATTDMTLSLILLVGNDFWIETGRAA